MSFIKGILKFLFFSLQIIRKGIFFIKKLLKKTDDIKFIFFIPVNGKGWILEFLTKDLLKANRNLKEISIYINNYFEIIFFYLFNPTSRIICFSYGFASYLINRGFPMSDIIVLFTHKKEKLNPLIFKKFNHSLFMNNNSRNYFIKEGLSPSRAHYFPIGYDPEKFLLKNIETQKIYDLVIPMKYVHKNLQEDYYNRKNYITLIPVINNLAKKGIKICIVGKYWQECDSLSKEIVYFDLEHDQTCDIYNQSKFSLCLSLNEGGFTGLLETIACGCNIISHEVGFANDLKLLLPEKVHLLKFLNSIDEYALKIEKIINEETSYNLQKDNLYLSQKLDDFNFRSLSSKLLNLN